MSSNLHGDGSGFHYTGPDPYLDLDAVGVEYNVDQGQKSEKELKHEEYLRKRLEKYQNKKLLEKS